MRCALPTLQKVPGQNISNYETLWMWWFRQIYVIKNCFLWCTLALRSDSTGESYSIIAFCQLVPLSLGRRLYAAGLLKSPNSKHLSLCSAYNLIYQTSQGDKLSFQGNWYQTIFITKISANLRYPKLFAMLSFWDINITQWIRTVCHK